MKGRRAPKATAGCGPLAARRGTYEIRVSTLALETLNPKAKPETLSPNPEPAALNRSVSEDP